MKYCQIILTGLLGLALAGCHNDPNVALLERDNFKKDLEINRLRGRIEELEGGMTDVVSPSPSSSPPTMTRGPLAGEMPAEPGAVEGGPAMSRPAPAFTPGRSAAPFTPGGLKLDMGTEAKPGEVPETMRTPGTSDEPKRSPPPGGAPSGRSGQWSPAGAPSLAAMNQAENGKVAQITLHPALTGGIGSGGRPGDEGLLVVVEPRDFSGNIVNATGDINVALLDPALEGEQARLARWDFPAAQAETMIRGGSQPGIHLRLPWTATPAHDRLKVFVRYTTRDGRKLQTERLISVALSGPQPQPEVLPTAVPARTADLPKRPEWSPLR